MIKHKVAFKLTTTFVDGYRDRTPPFGFNGLGELVYLRTYSRLKDDGTQERWHETVRRVVEGTYSMQKRWITEHNLGWSERKAQRSAQEMYDRIYNMKFLPPGRGLWAMGSALTEEKGLYAALFNCGFVSTATLAKDLAEPFTFLMDASMLGIGVGFDTKGAGTLDVHLPTGEPTAYVIPDTREGWVESVKHCINSYFLPGSAPVEFDYSKIRPAGEPIRGFGGVASGPEPLRQLHEEIRAVLGARTQTGAAPITVTDIVDIMNLIGKCVVSGNVRRTAEIAFGEPGDDEFIDLKNYDKNPHRAEYGWTSNNSVFADLGMDYGPTAERVALNGEPGYAWLENMRAYGRMGEAPDYKDKRVGGGNPCLEQSLESYETCNLVETFPANHRSLEDYRRTLKFAYLYAKTVTLGKTPWAKTNRIALRNRRIGLSQSGIQQAIAQLGIEEFRSWCEAGYATIRYYDDVYSEWLGIPKSVKVTSVKPSGSVSLLAGATPGMHWPEDLTYIRRMRLSEHSDLVQPLLDAGYVVEPDAYSPQTVVVEVPVKIREAVRTAKDVSMWEQLSVAAFLQRYWADNQVSATISFNPVTEGPQIAHALDYFQYQLKGVSFLPRLADGAYQQMPYEAIDESTYEERVSQLRPIQFGATSETAVSEKYCDSSSCVV
jgi:ribonucleoside-triphosphate reductase (thioredoxin)